MNDEVLEEDFNRYAESALGFSMPWTAKMRKHMDELNVWADKESKAIFKKLPIVDRWTSFARITICSVTIIPPLIFTFFWIVVSLQVLFHNWGFV